MHVICIQLALLTLIIYPLDRDLSGLVDIVIHTVKPCEQLGPDLNVFCFCFSFGEDVKEPTP